MRSRFRSAPLWGLLLALSPALRAQEKPEVQTKAPSRQRIIEVARRIMIGARFCTLVTIGDLGQPQARVVDPLEPDAALAVHIATNPRSRKVAEINRDQRVTLLYFDTARSAYVTLIGRAVELPDAAKTGRRKKDWDAFFPAATPGAYVLYRIVPSRLEVVSASDGLSGDPATWRPEIVEFK